MTTGEPKKTSCSDASNFALLSISRIPRAHSEFAALKSEGKLSRLLLGELVRTGAFRERLLTLPPARRLNALVARFRRVFHIPPQKTDRALVDEFTPFLARADELIDWLLARYVPERYHPRLRVRRRVRASRNLVTQYLACFPTPHDGLRAHRYRFEVRRRLLLALYLYEIAMGEGREDLLEHDIHALEQYLSDRFFITGKTEPARIRWVRNPERQNRVARFLDSEEDPAREERHLVSALDEYAASRPFRFFRWRDGTPTPVLFVPDTKRPFPHLLKMFVKNQRSPESVRDLRRAMLVFRNRRELLRGLVVLRRDVWDIEAQVADQRWSIDGNVAGDPRSDATADEYRHLSFEVPVFGSRYEIQILLLEDWVNSFSSDGPEHHARYKAKQYLDRVFPLLFPEDLYRISWASSRVRRRILEKIGAENHQCR